MQRIHGVVQHYAWGDPSFIPDLLGVEADGRPWAELWLGTHPAGPATLEDGRPLQDVTGSLPYLLKVLAAAEPLSMQTHPNTEQARHGFARGVYGDDRAKPELLRALTRFEALCGIRPVDATLAVLDDLDLIGTALATSLVERGPGGTIRTIYADGLEHATYERVVTACRTGRHPTAQWIARLAELHPGDRSVVVALLLNHVVLESGEAIRLGPGTVHAYLHGAGIELMGASDNVVRAGLTSKHVDIDELLRIIDLAELAAPVVPAGDRLDLVDAGVSLRCLAPGESHRASGHELTIDLRGSSSHLAPGDVFESVVESFVVTASTGDDAGRR